MASSIIASGMASTKPTMIGEIELGIRWRRMMYQGEAPSACAARTNSFSRKALTCARTSRHTCTQPNSAAMRTMVKKPPPVSAPSSMAASSGGTTENSSMMRMMNQSIRPPK